MTTDIRILSYNIHHGVGVDGRLDLDRIADVIARTGADIVGLQEVDRHFRASSSYADQLAELDDRLGMESAFGPALEREPTTDSSGRPPQYGVAVLSSLPIVAANVIPLSGGPEAERRVALETTFDLPNDEPLSFATTHLGPAESARRRQIDDLLDGLGTPSRRILVGDCNATPGSRTVERLTEQYRDAFARAGLRDTPTFPTAYVESGDASGEHRVRVPERRIDYVFVAPALSIRDAARIESLGSDHSAVVADVTLAT